MAENLNFNYNAGSATSYCYGNADAYCTIYGRLYTWSAAMDSVGAFSSNGLGCGYGATCDAGAPVRGACPEGWHLPSQEEFQTLVDFTGGEDAAGMALKSTTGWDDYRGESGNGTNAYGFAGFAAGADYCGRRSERPCFANAGTNAYFWTSTAYTGTYSNYAHALHLSSTGSGATLDTRNGDWSPSGDETPSDPKNNAFSVRCLKD